MSELPLLIVKTGALGDVLRTTSILPGLRERFSGASLEWLTAPSAVDLLRTNPLVDRRHVVSAGDARDVERATAELAARRWSRVLSFDDEEPLCRLVSALDCERVSGAFLDDAGQRAYSDDTAPWFGMGLLARDGKEAADRRKLQNRRTHPELFASMLGIAPGEPTLVLDDDALAFGREFRERHGLGERAVLGLNTGAGGRWPSKQLPIERTVELARRLAAERGPAGLDVLLLGGRDERERNDAILAGLAALPEAAGGALRPIDAGTENSLLEFAALVAQCSLLVSSDSLAMHVAIALRVPLVAFFAPTSAAEIELYGRGVKVASTSTDACTYRPDVDTSTLTVERLADAARSLMPALR